MPAIAIISRGDVSSITGTSHRDGSGRSANGGPDWEQTTEHRTHPQFIILHLLSRFSGRTLWFGQWGVKPI